MVGAGADGHKTALCAGLDDGNVQQGRQAGVRRGELDRDCTAAGSDGGHLIQAGAVTLGGHSPPQSSGHVLTGDGRAVGEGEAAAEGKGIRQRGLVVIVISAEGLLGGKAFVQPEQPLIEQGPHRLLHPVGAGDGIQGLLRQVGQGEPLRQRGRSILLYRVFLTRLRQGTAAAGQLLSAASAAAEEQRQSQRQGGQSDSSHGSSLGKRRRENPAARFLS